MPPSTKLSLLALTLTLSIATAAPTSSTPSKRHSSHSKRGVAYNYASKGDTSLLAGHGKISWAHDWDSDTYGSSLANATYIPTLWSDESIHTSDWKTNAEAALSRGAHTLFSFNEPDNKGQANMSPQRAAEAWKQHVQPFAGRASLCAPAVSNGVGPGLGFDWLDEFLRACSGCTIDCVNVHWYATPASTAYFEEYVKKATGYGKPVWLSEFAVVDGAGKVIVDPGTVETFLAAEMPFLDGNADVAGYAYYYAAEGYLVKSGRLSGYGEAYVYS